MTVVIILAAACTKMEEQGSARISFTAVISADATTRSVADGSGVDHVWCGAYLDGTLITQAEATVTDGMATLELDLANNSQYDIVMWAGKNGNALWSFDPETALVTAAYANQTASSAVNDAFWYKGTLVPNGAQSIGIELSRAVAQIHIGTTTAFTSVTDVVVTVSAVPSTWNLLTGAMGGEDDRTFSLGTDPGETFTINATTYNCLAAVCILAPETKTTTNVGFTLNMDGNPVAKNITNTSIRRNWCTRIAGDF